MHLIDEREPKELKNYANIIINIMKKIQRISVTLIALMIIGTQGVSASSFSFDKKEEAVDTTNYKIYTGKIIDASDQKALPFATIEAEGMNVATVTNIDGEFILKISKAKDVGNVKVSYIGYKNKVTSLENYQNSKNKVIKLEPSSVSLQEVTIRPEDAEKLIKDVLANIRDNYSTEAMMMTAFYRETIKKKRNYVSISEAVVDIYKSPYENDFRFDQVKLIQGRKSADVEKMDTVLFRVQGGPVTTLLLDVVKNPYILLSNQYDKIYSFYVMDVISIDDRLHYVISFLQKENISTPFYKGKLYVDMDRLAITEAEFELNMENEVEAAQMFIRKKPIGMSVIPKKAIYRSKYTIQENVWYFSYARAEVKFNVDWEKKLFNTSYSTMSEIAITERSFQEVTKFENKERFKRSQVLDNLVYVFFDQDFWGEYNVIEPDQTIESAIKRLNKKYLKKLNSEPQP